MVNTKLLKLKPECVTLTSLPLEMERDFRISDLIEN
jgi:hypothetical protein